MSWMIIIGIVALAIVAFEFLMRGPSVFVIDDPRMLSDSLRMLVARGKNLASLSIQTRSPNAHLRVQKFVERKKRISFAITADVSKPFIETDAGQTATYGLCEVEYPCLESGVDQVVSCLRLALDEAHMNGGGTLPIRGEGSLSGILAFNVSEATGVVKVFLKA